MTSDLAPTIRVLVPGTTGAEVTATVIPASGDPIVIKSKVGPQHTIQLPFAGVADGIYTVVVSSSVPIVSGVRTVQNAFDKPAPLTPVGPTPTPTPTPKPGSKVPTPAVPAAPTAPPTLLGGDFTWTAAAFALSKETLLAVPAGPRPTLTLFNPSDTSVSLSIEGSAQGPQKIDIAAGRTFVMAVDENAQLRIHDAAGIHAAITYQAVGRGASFPVAPASRLSSAITVYSH